MSNLQKFTNELFLLEVKSENGESLFDVESVARSLGLTQMKNGKEYIRWETVNKYLKKYLSQEVGKNDYISEPMVYKLAFRANNSLADKFQDWLAVEVLPTIRKNGMYATDELLNNPDLLIEVANKLKEERTLRLVAEQRVNELQPKADYYDNILNNPGLTTVTAIAKNYGMGAPTFNKLLHDLGVQYNQSGVWFLYSKHQDKGYTHTEPFDYVDSNGRSQVKVRTKWTTKGHIFLYQLLKRNDVLPMIEQEQLA
ncbi:MULTISPECIES: phage antirepressor KilAC domain-containing protein [Enterococcus]|uniref:Bro-N domain-containing protein n=1 Tax=Candidatus Enterococcus mangumiae TaxID=2230878 RepID=A0ABZ2SZZ4_9ENTE|nr:MULTISPECIES: phage antirepressor KilAC domain-containing protein [unclassified Enterococcus]MBO0490647.1 phage antirepressor KilAC domain-containing protein [Enterococcus sp. DIV1094]MBO1298959.1 phage antirepressor KilAC domain-containing protein [Enterococcus sp. DIV1271a]